MAKFQKKSNPASVIDVVQYTGGRENLSDIRAVSKLNFSLAEDETFKLHVQGVDTIVERGDYVARSGENVFVIRGIDFLRLYEPHVPTTTDLDPGLKKDTTETTTDLKEV